MPEASMVSKCVAEFMGTFLLVFTVGCNVLGGDPTWAGVSIGCALMVLIFAWGPISGGSYNPAVSMALGLSKALGGGGLDWMTVVIYCAVETIAGVAAGFSYRALFGQSFTLSATPGFKEVFSVGASEFLYTFMLCFVVLNVAVSKGIGGGQNKFYALAIASVVVAGAYGAGSISGGCFNPAVAIGIDASSEGFGSCLLYTVFEILGACLAAALFRVVRPEDFGGEKGMAARLASEFIGTYMLVVTVGLNVCAGSQAAAFSIAAGLMSLIYALGDVSGAQFNPAVTLAVKLSDEKFTMSEALQYAGVQILGGICAAGTYSVLACTTNLGPTPGYSYAGAAVAEIVFTFVLCTVVLTVAVSKSGNSEMFGLAIGSCVTAGGFAIGGISGGSFNPAVSVGIAFSEVFSGGLFYEALIYTLFELIGAALAAGVYRITHAADFGEALQSPKEDFEISAVS